MLLKVKDKSSVTQLRRENVKKLQYSRSTFKNSKIHKTLFLSYKRSTKCNP